MKLCLFFIKHCNDNDQEKVNIKQILRAVKEIDTLTTQNIHFYFRVFGLNSSQTSFLRDIVKAVKAVKAVKLRRKDQKRKKRV